MSQKLTLKARAAKAKRDLAYANSPDRKKKRADSQKKRSAYNIRRKTNQTNIRRQPRGYVGTNEFY